MTFITWLKKQKDRDNAIGDLARDMIMDIRSGANIRTAEDLETRMLSACEEAKTTLKKARREYNNLLMLS